MRSAPAASAHNRFNWKSGKLTAIREKKWKLIYSATKTELFDILNDPGEAVNMAAESPEVVKHLREQSLMYWDKIGVKSTSD